jgi:hypothetical protein
MTRPYLPNTMSSCALGVAATLLVGVVSCGGGDFAFIGDEAGVGSSSGGNGGSSSGRESGSSSGASSGGHSSGGSGAGSGSGASSGGSGGGSGGSSNGFAGDSGVCPAGLSWCAPCPGFPGRCTFACPAIFCAIDSGGGPDGTVEASGPLDGTVETGGPPDGTIESGGPPDAKTGDSSVCPPGEHLCPGCGGSYYCTQGVCPAILCIPLDAAFDVLQGNGCNPACSQDQTCCPGGAVGSYYCATLDGATCPLVP